MIVPSLHVPDARAVLRYTDNGTKTDVYVAVTHSPRTNIEKINMLRSMATKLGLQVSIQNFPDLSKDPE